MVMIFKKVVEVHRKNAKGRRSCVIKEKKIPGPLGRVCKVPRPAPLVMSKMKKK